MLTSKQCFIFLGILSLNTPLLAKIVTDGTLGIETSLTDPNIEIPADLGQQHSSNLFHSFKEFNINTGQTATFTGPDTVQNILTRVTGDQRSFLDGTLRSEIPNANLYLLNPNGIVFGENASLDVQGSFHTSTADYIRFGDGGHFYTNPTQKSTFTSATPEAFGFLKPPEAISLDKSHLQLPYGQTLSIIGGDLTMTDSILVAPSGQINLASVASAGEVEHTSADLVLNHFERLGTINLSQSSSEALKQVGFANLDVSGLPAGQVFIRAGRFYSQKGIIFADTYEGEGKGIDILATEEIRLDNGARITADNSCYQDFCESQGGSIFITTPNLFLSGENNEISEPWYDKLSTIATNNRKPGRGGNLTINTSTLEISPGLIQSATEGGDAGNIRINAQQLTLHGRGLINAATASSGKAGNLIIEASDSVTLDHYASISASASKKATGEAGTITLTTRNLTLRRNSYINGFNEGTGPAGSLTITTETTVIDGTGDDNLYDVKTGIYTEADHAGGGNINLLVHDRLEVVNSKITAESRGTHPQDKGGNLTIRSPKIFTLDNSRLLANAYAGNGGDIILETPKLNIQGDNWEINVSSQLGWNGQFVLNHTKLNGLVTLEKTPLPKLPLLPSRCASFSKENLSRFIITARDILPRSPEDLRTPTIRLQ